MVGLYLKMKPVQRMKSILQMKLLPVFEDECVSVNDTYTEDKAKTDYEACTSIKTVLKMKSILRMTTLSEEEACTVYNGEICILPLLWTKPMLKKHIVRKEAYNEGESLWILSVQLVSKEANNFG